MLEIKKKRYNVYLDEKKDVVSLDRFKKLQPINNKTEGREEQSRKGDDRKSER